MNDEAYESCEWIEGGLAFNRRSLHSCLIVHHHTGMPFVADYNGGEIPIETLLAVREQIRAANHTGNGDPACRGCAHLKKQKWPRSAHAIDIVGIAHYSYCNIKCSYCFLQTQDPASFVAGHHPYSLVPVVHKLIADGLLAPHAIIDWGGGEPTSYPEFDQLLELLLAHGTTHYIHTNGTRFPPSLRRVANPERVHVICSIDAGLPETYRLIKQKDYLERVWGVLEKYLAVGAIVTLKYIVKVENSNDADLEAFAERAGRLHPRDAIIDFDYDFPDPGAGVVAAMGRLKALTQAAGIPARFGFTGANFTPEHDIASRAETAFLAEQHRRGRPDGPPPQSRFRPLLGPRALLRKLWRGLQNLDRVTWLEHDLPAQWPAGGLYRATVRLRNDGSRVWPMMNPEGKGVALVVLVDGVTRHVVALPHDLAPGRCVTLAFDLSVPAGGPSCEVKLSLLEQNVVWLEQTGADSLLVRMRRLPPRATTTSTTPETESCDAVQETQPNQLGNVGRRLWNLPLAPRSPHPDN